DTPVLLHVDLTRSVHHDLGDCIVIEQRLDGTEAENLRDDGLEEAGGGLTGSRENLLVGGGGVWLSAISRPPHGRAGIAPGWRGAPVRSARDPAWGPAR